MSCVKRIILNEIITDFEGVDKVHRTMLANLSSKECEAMRVIIEEVSNDLVLCEEKKTQDKKQAETG